MKNKLLLLAVLVMATVCLLAISVSADTIVKSTSDEFGDLTLFDDAIGNTNISQLKDDGTIARTVLFDGENYYTVPTTYILTESYKNQGGKTGEMFLLSFNEIGNKLGKTFNKNSIIRCEFPSDIAFICNGNENMSGCANVVEIVLNDGLRFWDNGQRKAFTNCKKLKSIDLSGMIIEYPNSTFALLEYCESLEYVKFPDAYFDGENYVNYDTDHMLSGCKKLVEAENVSNFLQGVISLGYKTFYNCHLLPGVTLWDSLTTIEGRAFGNCHAFTEMIIPNNVRVIGTTETVFESCKNLKKVVLPAQVSLGNYCFEKCTGLTDVWMPTEPSTFGVQVFGQCGNNLNVNFYFVTAQSTITISNAENKLDPFITALGNSGDARIKYSTPISAKCEIFLGEHVFVPAEGDRIVYPQGYASEGVIIDVCTKCTTQSVTTTPALFVCLGYSATENGDGGLAVAFKVDKSAVAAYQLAVGKTIEYGVFTVLKSTVGTGEIFDEKGEAISGAIFKDLTMYELAVFELKIVGFGMENKDVELAMGAYVATSDEEKTEYSYIQMEEAAEGYSYSFVSLGMFI